MFESQKCHLFLSFQPDIYSDHKIHVHRLQSLLFDDKYHICKIQKYQYLLDKTYTCIRHLNSHDIHADFREPQCHVSFPISDSYTFLLSNWKTSPHISQCRISLFLHILHFFSCVCFFFKIIYLFSQRLNSLLLVEKIDFNIIKVFINSFFPV